MKIRYAGAWEWFRLPVKSLASLDGEGVPGNTLQKLKELKKAEFETQEGLVSELKNILSLDELEKFQGLVLQYAGPWKHSHYPHRLELLDLQNDLESAGLPRIQSVAYRKKGARELCIKFKKPPEVGEYLPIRPEIVSLSWHQWPDRHKDLDAKLVFQGLQEALFECGYEVISSIRAGSDGSRRRGKPIAMMVKFAVTPKQPEWAEIKTS